MSTTRFAKLPTNFKKTYRTAIADANLVSSVTDRRLDTSSAETVFVLDLSANTRATHLFVKAKGLVSVSVTDAGGTMVASQTVAAYAVTDAQGHNVEFDQDGFQNLLLPLTGAPLTTTSLTVTAVYGTGGAMVELAALDVQLELDAEERFSQFDFRPVWRGWTTHQNINGRLKGVPPVNAEPYRRDLEMTIKYLDNASHQPLLNFLYENPNFCLVPEYDRYPHILFSECTLPNWELQLRYLAEDLKTHQALSLLISEA